MAKKGYINKKLNRIFILSTGVHVRRGPFGSRVLGSPFSRSSIIIIHDVSTVWFVMFFVNFALHRGVQAAKYRRLECAGAAAFVSELISMRSGLFLFVFSLVSHTTVVRGMDDNERGFFPKEQDVMKVMTISFFWRRDALCNV
jgi:hypothetical protein